MEEGWGFPIRSKKAHFFIGVRSLCGKWLYAGELESETNKKSPDDCAICRKKLDKRVEASNE